jgi:hypothetical protein
MKRFIKEEYMSKHTLHDVLDAVENEGFDYAMRFYSNWEDVDNEEFQQLYTKYIDAAYELENFLGE